MFPGKACATIESHLRSLSVKTIPTAVSVLFVALNSVAWSQAAQPPAKVGVIHFEGAISSTQQGQKALTELQQRYEPQRKELEKRQNEINALREQLVKSSSTLSDEARQKLNDEITEKTRKLNRDFEDAQQDYQQDLDKILQEFYAKMRVVVDRYAKDNGYTLILDIGSPQTPVVYVAEAADITNDVVALYDKFNPVSGAAAPAPAATPPAASSKPAAAPAKPAASPKP
jgi:outer membrane protein